MISTSIIFFNDLCLVSCDGKCDKAWGISNRPKIQLSDDEDDFEYRSDSELAPAPSHPGTWEGGEGKPNDRLNPEFKHNKWCVRECERSTITSFSERIILPDFSNRIRNIPQENHD